MPGIGLYMNWVNVTVTPTGASAIALTGVTSVSPSRSARQEMMYGDNFNFPNFIKNVEKKRSISITAANIGLLTTIPDNVACTISATLLDPKNGIASGGGAITVTLVNAVLEKQDATAQNNKYGSGTVTFNCTGNIISGSETDPLSWATL
jgi:hypothetical protein